MSFLKIQDPAKRDFLVENFLKMKQNIRQDSLSEKLGDISLQRELTKAYKPIIESQSGISKELGTIKENSKLTAEALRALPASISTSLKAIQFPQYPSIDAFEDDPVSDIRTLELGDVATKYLKEYAANKKLTDTTFGIYSKDGRFYIGGSPITIEGDDVTVGNNTYKGTPGLWELMTMKEPNETLYSQNDLDEYREILESSGALYTVKNPNKPKSSRGKKYNKIIKPMLKGKSSTGEGVVVLPQDPDALVEMLALRMASFGAGNTGLRNEIVGISDELLRQNMITDLEYKNLMIQL
jgi:hypothetical protein